MTTDAQYKLIVDGAKRRGATFPTQKAWLEFKAAIDQAFPAASIVAPFAGGLAATGTVTASGTFGETVPPPAPKDLVDQIDVDVLRIACPENRAADLAAWVDPTRAACRRWGIDTMREIASFLANIGVESAGLTRLSENMNYSAKRMAEVWPGRFAVNPGSPQKARQPNKLAVSLANNPEKLANHVYANRMGNGPPESGDGWRYRGYGPKQLTGKSNHSRFAKAIGIPVEQVPDYLRTPEGGMQSAGWFWFDNGMDALAATAGIEDDRKRINGGLIGVEAVGVRFDKLIAEFLERERKGGI